MMSFVFQRRVLTSSLLTVFFGTCLICVILVYKHQKEKEEEARQVKVEEFCPAPLDQRYKCHILPYLTLEGGTFDAALAKIAIKRTVVLSTVDTSFVDMAVNFYHTSVRRLQITNHMFVCTDAHAQELMAAHGLSCYIYEEPDTDPNGRNITSTDFLFGMPQFVRQTNMKTKIILSALMRGFQVLFSDVDMVLFQNPLAYMHCDYCDILVASDTPREVSTGLILIRPTHRSIQLHKAVLERNMCDHNQKQQTAFNQACYDIGSPLDGYIRLEVLSQRHYPSGRQYFEYGHRMFAGDNPCQGCIVVHNNHLPSQQAKVYRFKETHLWEVDHGGYYSNEDAKYLMYGNVFEFGPRTVDIEVAALRDALFLGHLLNRTVILPSFHCHGCTSEVCHNQKRCSLQTQLRIDEFDKQFAGVYREHTFLTHPKVPKNIRVSVSEPLLIKTKFIQEVVPHFQLRQDVSSFIPWNPERGAEPKEIVKWFGVRPWTDFSVLNFHSLYDVIASPEYFPEYTSFAERLRKGFKRTNYRQIGESEL